MMRVRRVVKMLNFAAGQDYLPDGLRIARPAFEDVAQVKRTQFILVGASQAVAAHRHQGNRVRAVR